MFGNFNFIRKNQRGSTVLLLAIAGTMITVFGFSVYRFLRATQNYGFIKTSNTKYALSARSLREVIGNPENCTEALKGQNYVATADEDAREVKINKDIFDMEDFLPQLEGDIETKFFLHPYKFIETSKSNIDKDWDCNKIPKIPVTPPAPDEWECSMPKNIRDIMMEDTGNKYYTFKTSLEMRITIKMQEDNQKIGFNYERLNVEIPLYINVEEKDKKTIHSCYITNTQAYVCEAQGGAYNLDETNLDKRCNPDKTCMTYGSANDIDTVSADAKCPDWAEKVMIGEAGYMDCSNPNAIGDSVKSEIKKTIKAELNKRFSPMQSSTNSNISSKVNRINLRNRKTCPCWPCGCSGTPLRCGRCCTPPPCYKAGYPITDSSYIAGASSGLNGAIDDITNEIVAEIDPHAFGRKICDVYNGSIDENGKLTESVDNMADTIIKEGSVDEGDLVTQTEIRDIISKHMNKNIKGKHAGEIAPVATSGAFSQVDLSSAQKEGEKTAKKEIKKAINKLHTGSGDRMYVCHWCNKHRWDPKDIADQKKSNPTTPTTP